jgi:hypothetical protein
MDAPYIPGMVSLGPDVGRYAKTNDTTPNTSKTYYTCEDGLYKKIPGDSIGEFAEGVTYFEVKVGSGYVYKINVPGWLYRCKVYNPGGQIETRGETAILLADDPSNLVSNSSAARSRRMLYMTGTNGDGDDSANNMFPIHPGLSTYAYFQRDTRLSSPIRELLFVPAVVSMCYGIRPEDMVSAVGLGSQDISIEGNVSPGSGCESIFGSDPEEWLDNFRIMFGRRVADERAQRMKFVGDVVTLTNANDISANGGSSQAPSGFLDFRDSRRNWLSSLGVSHNTSDAPAELRDIVANYGY